MPTYTPTPSHEMELVAEKDGVTEWYCPTCGRRIVCRVSPVPCIRVIEPGDEHANHSSYMAFNPDYCDADETAKLEYLLRDIAALDTL